MVTGIRKAMILGLVAIALGAQGDFASGQFYPGMRTGPVNERMTTLEAATLQTAAEQEIFKLRRAKEFADDGDFRSANALWQSVLDQAGSQLTTNDQLRYRSKSREYVKFVTVASQIEAILSKLSTEGLASYRLKADAEARALLNHSADQPRIELLSEVVRRFFLSTEGDEAAFELACLKMDTYDFNDASRLLKKCLDEHPDCTVPRKEILLRLSVANARIGDSTSSAEMLRKLSAVDPSDKRIAIVERSNRDFLSSATSDSKNQNSIVKYGDAQSSRTMGSIAKEYFTSEFSERWSFPFEVNETNPTNQNNPYAVFYGGADMETFYALSSAGIAFDGGSMRVQNTKTQKPPVQKMDRKILLGNWKQKEWVPVGNLLLNEGLVYFKNGERVVCASIETGETKWMGNANEFQLDPATAMSKMMMQFVKSKIPRKSTEVQLFGDQVHQSMALNNGQLYCLEGPMNSDPKATPVQPQMAFNMSTPSRGRRNWLAAYDAQNGKLLWRRRGHDDAATDSNFDIGFSVAPVPGAELVYTTINDNGAISLLAINPENGKTVWKTFICDEPIGRCLPWVSNSIAYSGGDVYVGTGAGIIAAVESVSGVVRWMIRYERTGTTRDTPSPFGIPTSTGTPIGWREDVVVPVGRSLLVMGSDSDKLFALDRRTGELIWDAPRELTKNAVDYYLGVIGNRLYVAGKKIVRCYDIEGGSVVWDCEFTNSYGKGIVTNDAIYIPSGSSVLRLSTDNGSELGQSKLISTTREPVGNLFTDGKRLLAIGLSRIYSIEDLKTRMEKLSARVASGDVPGLLERMRLFADQGETEKAFSDMAEAYKLISQKIEPGESDSAKALERACEATLNAINELNLTTTAPRFVLQRVSRMVDDLSKRTGSSDRSADKVHVGINGVVYATLCSIIASRQEGLSSELLAIAPQYDNEALMRKAMQAIAATSQPADYELFRNAFKNANEFRRVAAIAGLVQSAKPELLVGDLKAILGVEKSDRVRLHCAIAMANAKERQSLSVLSTLLDSEDTKVRVAASDALNSITGQKTVSPPSTKVQQASVPQEPPQVPTTKEQWQVWIASNGESAQLSLPYVANNPILGRTLVCIPQGGQVREYDNAYVLTWSKEVEFPFAGKGLSNGHRLVCSFSRKEVIEYDEMGREFWRVDVAAGNPIRITRLENGNTLVLTQNESMVTEYRVDKSIAWQHELAGVASDAQPMANGNMLIAFAEGQVQEVSRQGEVVWSLSDLANPVCAQPLENGNVLIGLAGNGGAIEFTREKKRVWTKTGLAGVMDLQRLENGNTLIVDQRGVQMVDSQGKSVATKFPQAKSNEAPGVVGVGSIIRRTTPNSNERIFRAHRF